MTTLRPRRQPSVLPAHAGHPGRYRLAIVVALLSLLTINAPVLGAQSGTPTADLDAPDPAECTVAPRSEAELRALFREAAATPVPSSFEATPIPAIPDGEPADAQTVAEITATWRQYLACLSGGDQARMFAIFSDDMVRRQLLIDIAFGVTEEALFAFLAATPVPLTADQFVPFVPFDDVRVLADGRVAAIGRGDGGRGDVRIFVKTGDRWLLDEWFDLS